MVAGGHVDTQHGRGHSPGFTGTDVLRFEQIAGWDNFGSWDFDN
jgi:hypothetical protein